jgi:Domain of unknown function (DUF397)
VTINPAPVTANPAPLPAKPTVCELGIDLAAQAWRRSGHGDGAFEIAFARGQWVLMRVAGDPERRVLVFDRHEWECFLEGARDGEFDDAARDPAPACDVGPGRLLDL